MLNLYLLVGSINPQKFDSSTKFSAGFKRVNFMSFRDAQAETKTGDQIFFWFLC